LVNYGRISQNRMKFGSITVTATDAACNTASPASQAVSIKIDTPTPTVTNTNPANGSTGVPELLHLVSLWIAQLLLVAHLL
jgi:hypothetical protein